MSGTTRTKKDVPNVHAAFPVCTANFRVNRGASLQPNRTGFALFASTAPMSGVISIQSVDDARSIRRFLSKASVAGDVGDDESGDSIRTRARVRADESAGLDRTARGDARRKKMKTRTRRGACGSGACPNPHGGLASSRERTSGQDCVPRATRALERGTASTPVASASFDVRRRPRRARFEWKINLRYVSSPRSFVRHVVESVRGARRRRAASAGRERE